jgi:exonuclease SbcC
MRLIRLRLRNFRQHADTEVFFRPGLTGIIGPNGAGKSTILEAIAWAVYGAPAARGTNDTIRFNRAGARTRVEVELEFGLGGHEFRVVRTLSSAEVYLDGGAAPVAATLGGATAYLQARIGMSREEFFNTYFTGQKELQFLSAMGPAERGRFLSQVLGYERLRRAQDLVRGRRSELRQEIKGRRSGLGDIDQIVAERLAAEHSVADAVAAHRAAREALEDAGFVVRELAPRWQQAQAAREQFGKLTHAIDTAQRERDAAWRDVLRAEGELESVAKAEAELAPLRLQLADLPAVTTDCERQAELARKDEKRKALARQLAELDEQVARARERLARVEQAPELEKKYAEELEALRAERAEAERDSDEKKTAWLRDRQDAETKLQTYRDQAAELKDQIRKIQEMGPEGACPTCGRPMGADYQRLLDEMEDQWVSLVQDGKWLVKLVDQLKDKPEKLVEAEAITRERAEQVDACSRKLTRCEEAVKELKMLRAEQAQREERRASLAAEVESVPSGYDRAQHDAVEARLKGLRETEKRAARLEEAAARRPAWERDRLDAQARETAAAERGRAVAAERAALAFSEDGFVALRTEYEAASERVRMEELRATALREQINTAEQALQGARRREEAYHDAAREIIDLELDLRYHEELDLAFSELRAELNSQVRPELSEIASTFLAQLTDGRYTAMEIDDAYNILVLDEGEEKPVISGGEEDVANLVLRLSLSQMIAERAGHPLSLLILDEVFGSLDVARRDNVVQLLHHLEDRFEQVILITHIDGIRESLDQVLRVEYDERTGTAVVREESFSGEDPLEPGMAAD